MDKETKNQGEPAAEGFPLYADVMRDRPVLVQLKCSLSDIEKLYKKNYSHSENSIELAKVKIANLLIDNNFKYAHVFNIIEIKDI